MDDITSRRFSRLQEQLAEAWLANRPGARVDHVLFCLPSHSVAESLLAHYGPRVRALEHRYLVAYLMLDRIPGCELVFLCSQAPDPDVLAYYDSLVVARSGRSCLDRFHLVVLDDGTPRAASAKLLDRPELISELKAACRGRPAFLQPWNVTDLEVEVALELGVPLNGTSPALWPMGFKSAGRRLMADTGVPVPFGVEDVRSVDDVVASMSAIQVARRDATGVVVKLDDSGAGDGNVVVGLRTADGAPASERELRDRIEALPAWYLTDLAHGGVVEELVAGVVASPSAQVSIAPTGEASVLATHEQVLGGDSGQVFVGCRFPADPRYAAAIAAHADAVGDALAARGAVGRVGVDFVVTTDATGACHPYALEINLRNGGTTHPFTVLRNLVPGHYDAEAGHWVSDDDGSTRAYQATDNMVDIAWLGLPPAAVIAAVDDAGLSFDHTSRSGVVLHMLSCLAIDGRFGLTAIGRTSEHAAELFEATRRAVDACVNRQASRAVAP